MFKYKPRWFYSKQGLLILSWIAAVGFSVQRLIMSGIFIALQADLQNLRWLIIIGLMIVSISGVVSGWLADAKVGNYKTVKAGLILIFTGSVLLCVVVIMKDTLQQNRTLLLIALTVIALLLGLGVMAFITNSLQLGIDQMPDVSSTRISSFIFWYTFSAIGGFFIGETLTVMERKCTSKKLEIEIERVSVLAPVAIMSIALITDFILAEKWLVMEPKTPQSFKTIYQVLKFAVKNKVPLNRSALTYWEEDIPSRIDLGKSKYGGPFTTEQVEDVKTILRLLVISFSFWVIAASFGIQPENTSFQSNWPLGDCQSEIVHLFTNSSVYMLISIVIHELIIFPLFRHKLPSSLRRIGHTCIVIVVISMLLFVIDVVYTFYPHTHLLFLTSNILYSIATTFCTQIITTSMLEFVCAQAPYNMRGLFVGYTTIWIILVFTFNEIGGEIFSHICGDKSMNNNRNCNTVYTAVKIVCSFLSLIFYCLVARWYKMRVRDENYNVQRVVEEVYDRYLTLAANYRR